MPRDPVHGGTGTGWRARLLDGRHPLPVSIGLHLLPGVPVVVAYVVLAVPLARALGYPPVLGFLLAACVTILPVQLGLLLWLGRRGHGRPSLQDVVRYRDRPVRRGRLAAAVAALVVWSFALGALLSPVDAYLHDRFFRWVPQELFIGVGPGEYLTGHARAAVLVTLVAAVLLSGLVLPAVEELYFRGFLLPRLAHLGGWAPVLNTVLFALYHLWTPWQAVSRVVFFLPTVWATWRTRDLRIALWVHCLGNTAGALLTAAAVLVGLPGPS